jgi:hypothetical protein
VFTLVIWGIMVVGALLEGRPPDLLGHATTSVTEALDLGIIVPATFLAAYHLLRGRTAVGYLIAFPLLALLVALAPVIVAQTISQLASGITFTVAEIVGPISGFLVLGAVAGWLMILLLRHLPATAAPRVPVRGHPRTG